MHVALWSRCLFFMARFHKWLVYTLPPLLYNVLPNSTKPSFCKHSFKTVFWGVMSNLLLLGLLVVFVGYIKLFLLDSVIQTGLSAFPWLIPLSPSIGTGIGLSVNRVPALLSSSTSVTVTFYLELQSWPHSATVWIANTKFITTSKLL